MMKDLPDEKLEQHVAFELGYHMSSNPSFEWTSWPDAETTWSFVRGIFESSAGSIDATSAPGKPRCMIRSPGNGASDQAFLQALAAFVQLPHVITEDSAHLEWQDTNCIDFLGQVFTSSYVESLLTSANQITSSKYAAYIQLIGPHHRVELQSMAALPVCKVFRVHPDAVMPAKSKASDVGYDLTAIRLHKQLSPRVALYDTGIKVHVEHGLYAEVLPRSSLSKSGYMLANSVGVIDRSYNGNIYIALAQIDPEAPPIELPFRCCQLVFRRQWHVHMVEAHEAPEQTARGEGGFGSTGGCRA